MKRLTAHPTIFIAIALLAGCGGKSFKQEQRHAWHQEQARLFDVPIPIMAEPDFAYTWSDDQEGNRVLGYIVTADTTQELVEFYQANMERLGWRERAIIAGHEVLVTFEKPEKVCCVSVRPEGDEKMRLVLSVGSVERESTYS